MGGKSQRGQIPKGGSQNSHEEYLLQIPTRRSENSLKEVEIASKLVFHLMECRQQRPLLRLLCNLLTPEKYNSIIREMVLL